MAVDLGGRQQRHWADVLALLTGVILLGLVIWPGDHIASGDAMEDMASPDLIWAVQAGAGVFAILGVVLAQRWERRRVGRLLVGLGGLALLASMLTFTDFDWRAVLMVGLPGLALVIAALAVGPMPRSVGPEPPS